MKTIQLAFSVLCVAPLLQSCATQPGAPLAWEITPFMNVRHAMQGQTPEAYYQLGKYYQNQGRYELAIDAYHNALKADGQYVEAHNALGAIYAAQGHFDQAEEAFNAAIAIAPKMAHVHNNLGYAYFLQGNYPQAIVAFETAAKLDSSNRRTWNNLGMALARGGDQARSNEAFSRALELASPNTSAPASQAGQPAVSAIAAAAQAQELTPTSQPVVLAVPKDRGVIAPLPASVEKVELAVAAPQGNLTSMSAPETAGVFAIQEASLSEEVARPVASPLPNQSQSLAISVAAGSGYSIKVIPDVEQARIELHQLSPQVFELRASPSAPSLAPRLTADLPNQFNELQQLAQASHVIRAAEDVRPVTAEQPQRPLPSNTKHEIVHQVVQPRVPILQKASALQGARDPAKPLSGMPSLQIADRSNYRPLRYFRLELANGIGVKGLAKRMSALLIAKGAPKSVLSDQKPFKQVRTEIQYREGFASVATALSHRMSTHPAIVKVSQSRFNADVRIVLGKDLARSIAVAEGVNSEIQISDAALLSTFEGLFIKGKG